MPSGMMPMPPGMMFAGGGGARHPVMEGDGRSRSRRRRRPRAHSSSRSRRRRSPSESGSGAMSDESIICGSTKKPRKTARPASSDDDIPNSYRFLGGKHIFGDKAVLPKTQKVKALKRCNESEFNPLRLAAMEDHEVDELLFLATNCPPTLRLSELKIRKKGELRALLKKEYERTMRHHPTRMSTLAPDYSNLGEVATKTGYPVKFGVGGAGAPSTEGQLKFQAGVKQEVSTLASASTVAEVKPPPPDDGDPSEDDLRRQIEAELRAELEAEIREQMRKEAMEQAEAKARMKAERQAELKKKLRADMEASIRKKLEDEFRLTATPQLKRRRAAPSTASSSRPFPRRTRTWRPPFSLMKMLRMKRLQAPRTSMGITTRMRVREGTQRA